MAPATRRSSGLGANANSPSNLDHILEHFNQFKRKHITQNRDIIKTNALAQLRIKELEEKILAMEAEQTKSSRELIHVRRRMERAEKAAVCMRQGWQLIGAGMSAMSAIEGFDRLLDAPTHAGANRPMTTQESLYALQRIDEVRPSTRISLDPNALPGGVARNVSRPPEADLNDVMEERSAELIDEGRFIHSQTQQYEHIHFGSAADMHKAEATLESDDDDDDDDDGDSEHGDDEDVVSFGATDGEDTIRMQGGFEVSSNSTPMVTDASGLEETTFSQAAARDHAQHGPGSNATASASSSESAAADSQDHRLKHMPSIDSLSSFADDEEIELSTDDEDEQPYPARSLVDMSAITNALASHASRSHGESSNGKSNVVNGNGKPRKRKTPSSPDDQRRLHSNESVSCSQSEAELSTGEESSARPSRRASMRDRKSVNYALPKLNTKMRKPDPVDLIPAARSETKQRDSLMTSQRGSEDETDEAARGRMSDGPDDRPSSADTSQTTSPNPKTLKGQHGVASTGNLREIRKLHEQQQQKQQQQQQERQKHETHQGRRRASSQSDNDSTPRMDSEGSHHEPTTSSSSSANDSPRRRSSRKSQRRLSSSSTAQSDGTVTASEKAEEERETDSASNYSDAQTDGETLQGHTSKALAEQAGLPGKSNTAIANPAMAPTPRQKESNGTDAAMGVFGRGSLSAAATVGTPIPKPVIRNGVGGMPHGNIKALKVAGRMQKSSSTNSGLSNLAGAGKAHAGQRQALHSSGAGGGTKASLPLGPAGVKANSARQFAGPHARSVSAGTGKMGGGNGGGAANGGSQALPAANAGDPTKRNSLHAAMTTD